MNNLNWVWYALQKSFLKFCSQYCLMLFILQFAYIFTQPNTHTHIQGYAYIHLYTYAEIWPYIHIFIVLCCTIQFRCEGNPTPANHHPLLSTFLSSAQLVWRVREGLTGKYLVCSCRGNRNQAAIGRPFSNMASDRLAAVLPANQKPN